MKHSYYNVLAEVDEGLYALYNTYHQSMLALTSEEADAYKELESKPSVPDDFPDLYQALIDNHFILQNPDDEVEWLQYEFEKYKHNGRYFELTITPTLDCNFRCAYCYEKKRPGVMSGEVQDALMRFVEESFEEKPFKQLRIVWYGGEPLTEPEVIEALSKRFIAFCEEKGILYQASLMTNGYLADEAMMERMKDCRITSVQISFGGKGARHDEERIYLGEGSTYDTIFENTCRIAGEGIATHVEFVVDKDNYDSCLEVAEELGKHDNIYFHTAFQKADYNDDLFVEAEDGSKKPMFNYLDPAELDRFKFEYIMKLNPSAAYLAERLRPLHHYCGCSLDRFYVIDELGNVYKCICDVDKPETHAIFNICDPKDSRKVNWKWLLRFANQNPAKDAPCKTCNLYPICNGGCFSRDDTGLEVGTCSDKGFRTCRQFFKYTIKDFVKAYYWALVAENAGDSV